MDMAMALIPAMAVGFLGGLLTLRQKTRWCPDCGAMLTCPHTSEHVRVAEGASRWTA
jgi:hypothetical protein